MLDKNQSLHFKLKSFLVFLISLGINPSRFLSIRYFPKYIFQYRKFKALGGSVTNIFPILTDYYDQAGSAVGHYFHQDLLVASYIFEKNPKRHLDIGSRIDGFVAHVASYRKIDVMDVRDIAIVSHPNISFLKADLMDVNNAQINISDSISCLHAIEHFGLGRYGDPLDPIGHVKGFNNILRMLAVNGMLYISFPIGQKNEIHFNAHRVFHPKDIFQWLATKNSFVLECFDYVDDLGNLHRNVDIHNVELNVTYGCGIYSFRRIS